MHDLAVWRLAALGRERDGLAEDHREMLEAMGSGVAAYGAPAAAALRRIRAFEREIAAAEAELEAQTRQAIDQGARAKLADRARESLEAQLSRPTAAQGTRRSHRTVAAQSEVKLGVRLGEEASRAVQRL